MKKSKLLKSLGFASLAILIGFGATMAFAPLGIITSINANSLENQYTTEQGQGLITPKADDPVIYTTESGIDIKWGNDTSSSIMNGGQLTSGNLSGFPYFTTTNGTTTYTWVIIGRNADVTHIFTKPNSSYVFSSWKTTHNIDKETYNTNAYYFFNNTYETSSPAGAAVDATVSTSYVSDLRLSTFLPNANAEIPSGCILALSNGIIENCAFANASSITSSSQNFAGSSNVVRTKCANYYTNDTFGFGSNKSRLQLITLNQIGHYSYSYYHNTASTQLYFFPLASQSMSYYTDRYDSAPADGVYRGANFAIHTYLTADQAKLGVTYWERNEHTQNWIGFINESGNAQAYTYPNTSRGVRPACVLKL